MARYYRKKFRRFRRRGKTYRRRYKRTRRTFKKRSPYSKARRYIKYAARKNRAARWGEVNLRLQTHKQIIRSSNSNVFDMEINNFVNNHYTFDLYLNTFLTDLRLQDIVAHYQSWTLLSYTITMKIISTTNLYTAYDTGVPYPPATILQIQNGVPDGTQLKIYLGTFRDPTTQTLCTALNPDLSNNLTKILESGRYQRVFPGKKGVNLTWINATGYKGITTAIGTPTGTTPISTAFSGALPTWDHPEGVDTMINNQGAVLPDHASIRYQFVATGVIMCANRIPIAN